MKSFYFFLLLAFYFSTIINAQNTISGKSKVKQVTFKQTVNDEGIRFKPELEISNIQYTDDNGNKILDVNENSFISFTLTNIGKGEAIDVKADLRSKRKNIAGFSYEPTTMIGTIFPDQSTQIYIPILGNSELEDEIYLFQIKIIEINGFNPAPKTISIKTQKFQAPKVVVADAVLSTNKGKPVKLNYPIYVKALVQNIGEGIAENVVAEFTFPNDNCIALSRKMQEIGNLRKGESKEIRFSFVASQEYADTNIPLKIILDESYGKYGYSRNLSVSIGDNSVATHYTTNTITPTVNIKRASLTPDVDKYIPVTTEKKTNRLALIIGNEDYQSKQTHESNSEINVEFARNDARIFREYANKTMAIEEKNIFFLSDATAAEIQQNIDIVSKLATHMGSETEIVFYYAGHGLPDEATRSPYLIPVDVSGTNLSAAIAMKEVYTKLGNSGANKVTVFLDACFSGGGRNVGLLATRGIRIKPKDEPLTGNIVVFSASSEQQTALPYTEKQHGMFTYFLLKNLQETKGEISYGELSKKIGNAVAIESLRVNKKDQVPNVNFSLQIAEEWKEWKIK